MTTIVAYVRDGEMWADSLLNSEHPCASVDKVIRLKGALYGLAGDYSQGLAFLERLRTQNCSPFEWADPPDVSEVTIMRLTNSGIDLYAGSLTPIKILDKYHAIGSGAAYALGSMYNGASIYAAMEAAVRFDSGTGGKIRRYKL